MRGQGIVSTTGRDASARAVEAGSRLVRAIPRSTHLWCLQGSASAPDGDSQCSAGKGMATGCNTACYICRRHFWALQMHCRNLGLAVAV